MHQQHISRLHDKARKQDAGYVLYSIQRQIGLVMLECLAYPTCEATDDALCGFLCKIGRCTLCVYGESW